MEILDGLDKVRLPRMKLIASGLVMVTVLSSMLVSSPRESVYPGWLADYMQIMHRCSLSGNVQDEVCRQSHARTRATVKPGGLLPPEVENR